MRSTFFGIEMARRALSAHRTNADVIGHNLANAATEGYRKQRARLTPTEPYDQPGHPRMIIGSGVQVEEITRKQNRYLDREISSRTADHSLWSKRRELLAEIQDVLSEPGDTGIDSAMDRFWNSWDELAGSADDPALRSSLVERAGELGDSLRIALRQLNNMSDNLEQTIQTRVQKVNGILSELSEINGEVLALEAQGLNANDMLDRRDVLVEELSELIDITVTDSDDGGIAIDAGGIPVLDSHTSRSLKLGDVTGGSGGSSPAEVSFSWVTDGGSASEWEPGSGGELGALVDVRNADLPGLIDDIVSLSDTLRQSVNDTHAEGLDLNGDPGIPFFLEGSDPGYLEVNPDIRDDPGLVAAALPDDDGDFIGPSDGRNAHDVASLRHGELVDGATAGDFWRATVGDIGVRAEQAELLSENNDAMLTRLKNQRDALTGVSIDEELTHLIEAQNAFGAAARMVSVWDEMLDTVVNGMVR